MKNLFFCLCISLAVTAGAQNYRVVTGILPAYYQSEQPFGQAAGIKAFAVDTFSIAGQDSLFLTFATIRDTTEPGWETCLDSAAGSIMGRKILQQSNRTALFNFRQDSIIIINNSAPGDSWQYYSYANGDFIEANHQQTRTQDILGTSDSVKVIGLLRKDTDGNVIEDDINDKEILLSLNHGLIQSFDNYLFPQELLEISLIGFENPETGIINPDAKGVFDFEIGDEFHFESEDVFRATDPSDSVFKIIAGDVIQKMRFVTGKADYADSVVYHYSECSKIVQYSGGVPDTIYKTEDITEAIIFDSIRPGLLDAYPGQKIKHTEWNGYYGIELFSASNYNFHLQKMIVNDAFMGYDSCIIQSIFDPCCYTEYYIEFCGGPYYYWNDWWGNTIINKLVYFNKEGDEWGTRLAEDCEDLLSEIDVQSAQNLNISVYPNPFTVELFLTGGGTDHKIVQIKLFDINGSLLRSIELAGNRHMLNTNSLPDGIFILEIQFEDGYLIRRKVVKKRD